MTKTFSPGICGSTGIYVRFYVYLPSAYLALNPVGVADRRLLRVTTGITTNPKGYLSIRGGGIPQMYDSITFGGPTGSALSADTWHCLEMNLGVPSSATALQFWIDGTSAGTLTSDFSTSDTLVYNTVEFGSVSRGAGTGFTDGIFYLDELIVSDTYIGPADLTGPSPPPVVRDGTDPDIGDISTTDSTTQLSAFWDASTDNESGISGYQYAIGSTAGATDTVGWTTVGNVTGVTQTGLTLTYWQTYFFSVRAVNGSGVAGNATNSDGQQVINPSDTNIPPSAPPVVRDGTGADIVYAMSNTQLSANWDPSTDPDGSVTAYEYAIGTTAGGTNIVDWTLLGNVTTVTKTGLSLSNGQIYYFSVAAIDDQGRAGFATNSNGQTVDSTPLSGPTAVRDGTGPVDVAIEPFNSQLSANWDACTDAVSGISGYKYAIGYTVGASDVIGWTNLGNQTSVTQTGLSLFWGQIYYFSVKAVNGAGVVSSAVNSNGQTATQDLTGPSPPPAVRDGTGVDIATTYSSTTLSANWDASTDNESGISGYQYAIGTTQGGTDVLNWTNLGNVLTVTQTGLSLVVGQTYYFSVVAVNGAVLTGSATNSDGQTRLKNYITYFSDDFEKPGRFTEARGPASATNPPFRRFNTSTDQVVAGRKGLKITDTDTATAAGGCLIKTFSPVITDDFYVQFYLFLPTGWATTNAGGTRRIVKVFANDGSYSVLSLQGAVAETLAMSSVNVAGNSWSGPAGSIALSEGVWHCIQMEVGYPFSSGPMNYWVDGASIGTWASVSSGSSTITSIQMGDVSIGSSTTNGTGTCYWDQVVMTNFQNSPLDITAPTAPPAVRDGTGVDIATTLNTSQLVANWDASTDAESGISGYQYSIYSTFGGTQLVQDWTTLGNVTLVVQSGLSLTTWQNYIFSVRAVNGSGVIGPATNSNGQEVIIAGTNVPPNPPANVRDGTGADIAYAPSLRSSRPTGTPAPISTARSRPISMPSAPPSAAPTLSAGPLWATSPP